MTSPNNGATRAPNSSSALGRCDWPLSPARRWRKRQGLAQLCVGLTHALRGNATGAGRLQERGNGRLERYAATGGPTYGLDLAEFRTRIHRMAGAD